MSVKNVERQEKNKVKLTIEISAEAFAAAIEKVYRKNKGQIAIPGFRKGNAPRKLIEKMYGAELFYEEEMCIRDSLNRERRVFPGPAVGGTG